MGLNSSICTGEGVISAEQKPFDYELVLSDYVSWIKLDFADPFVS